MFVIPAKAGIQPFDKLRVTPAVMVSLSNYGFRVKPGMTKLGNYDQLFV